MADEAQVSQSVVNGQITDVVHPDSPVEAAPAAPKLLDLSKVSDRTNAEKGSKMTIHKGTVATSTLEGGDTVKETAVKRKLPSPLPAAMDLAPIDDEPMAVLGIPVTKATKSNLALEWEDDGRTFHANLRRLLRLKEVTIPNRTRMLLHLDPVDDPAYGPCVKIWWHKDSFVRVIARKQKEDEEQEDEEQKDEQQKDEQQSSN